VCVCVCVRYGFTVGLVGSERVLLNVALQDPSAVSIVNEVVSEVAQLKEDFYDERQVMNHVLHCFFLYHFLVIVMEVPKQLRHCCIGHILIVSLQVFNELSKEMENISFDIDTGVPILLDCVRKMLGVYKCFSSIYLIVVVKMRQNKATCLFLLNIYIVVGFYPGSNLLFPLQTSCCHFSLQ